jgi:hypothetical protein
LTGNFSDNLAFFNVIANLCVIDQNAIGWGAQHTARIAFRLAGIFARSTVPIDSPEVVSALGLNHGMAIFTTDESWAKAYYKGGI